MLVANALDAVAVRVVGQARVVVVLLELTKTPWIEGAEGIVDSPASVTVRPMRVTEGDIANEFVHMLFRSILAGKLPVHEVPVVELEDCGNGSTTIRHPLRVMLDATLFQVQHDLRREH